MQYLSNFHPVKFRTSITELLLPLICSIVMLFSTSFVVQATILVTDTQSGEFWLADLADTPESQQRGLMYRPYLLPWSAMLFIFPQPYLSTVWMKNTLIPLDIRFYDATGRLVMRYPHALPCRTVDCPLYPSISPVRYILETRARYSLVPTVAGRITFTRVPAYISRKL